MINAGACEWLRFLSESDASPNTVRNYGLRVAGFLSWLPAQGLHWTQVRASTLVQWKNHLLVTPVPLGSAIATPRKLATVAGWLVALVEFYRWAALEDLVPKDLVVQLTEDQVVRPGARGGEHGRVRSVMTRSVNLPGSLPTSPVSGSVSDEAPVKRDTHCDGVPLHRLCQGYRVSWTLFPVTSVPKVIVWLRPLYPDMQVLLPAYDQHSFAR